jgi:diguanylate cyclase (GGDEF)-like protein
MTAPAAETALLAAVLTCASALALAVRERARAHAARTALVRARARAAVFGAATRRLANAARASVGAVRSEIARAVREVAPDADGTLLYEEHDDALLCVATFGDRFAYFAGTATARDDGRSVAARALAAAHRVRFAESGDRLHPRDRDGLAVPLCTEPGFGSVLAVAAVRRLGDDAIEALVELAASAAPAYAIAREREHDRRRAEFDGLTGLLTPRAFRDRLTALVARAAHAPLQTFGLVFVDTDHFKRWNDEYGHAVGDALLRELATLLRTAAPASGDLVARNGGDEFCLVFTETGKAAAIERADALRRGIAALDLARLRPDASSTDDAVRITASIGVAAFPADAALATDLLECADAAMYHTKHTGRDGVSYAGTGGELIRYAQSCSPRPVHRELPPAPRTSCRAL